MEKYKDLVSSPQQFRYMCFSVQKIECHKVTDTQFKKTECLKATDTQFQKIECHKVTDTQFQTQLFRV